MQPSATGDFMRHPVSTSLLGSLDGAEVEIGVVGLVIEPGAPDDAQPGAGEDAHGMRVIAATLASSRIDAAGPQVGVARVVGQTSDGAAQSMVAGPAKAHAARLARLVGQRDDAGLGGQPIVAG